MVRLRALLLAGLVGVILIAVPALAAEHKEKKEKTVPDITGVWKGTSDTVSMGKTGHAEPSDSPKFQHLDWTLTIDKQDGPNFSGTKASAKGKETVVGVLDGAMVFMADDDGTCFGKLTGKNTMIVKYLEAGKDSKVASVSHFRREAAPEAQKPAGQ
ncbi:MAG: hypothetical protein AAGU21_02085 [Solidesulfovibrio sp.]|uniref:hypothetical protein n=1 Tax=Solidesulfovibrio sp. TaxID=2910990 RepID=UPI0031596647